MKRCLIKFLIVIFTLNITLASAFGSTQISSFVYQLQKINYEKLLLTNFDLAVIDWEEAKFSSKQLQNLQNQNKKIATYLSIGEAENYRDYWIEGHWDSNPPSFLEEENPNWKGNFKVMYWDPEWQKIIFNKLDKIILAGYDGVYLDIVDAYYYFEQKGRTSARQEMIDFVTTISQRAKLANPDFLIIPQNSAELIEDETFLSSIDGLGKESTWYNGNKRRNKIEITEELNHLDRVIKAGKFVLAIDYPTKLGKQCDFIQKAKKHGFVSFVSNRELDKIKPVHCKNKNSP